MRLYSENSFDDTILESPRLVRALKGHKRRLGLQRFDRGGSFEHLCRATSLLCGLYVPDERGDVALCKGVVKAADMFAGMICPTVDDVLPLTLGVERLDWSVDVPVLMGWCASCRVVGASAYDCRLTFFDRLLVQQSVTRAFNSFDNLDPTQYTSIGVVKAYLDDVKRNTIGHKDR